MIKAEVKGIGKNAISKEDGLVIFFDETATSDLKDVAIEQKILTDAAFDLKIGGSIKINSSVYKINYVGSLVNKNLSTIGHVTLVFKEVPDKPMESAIYLDPSTFPTFKVGDTIEYN
ncbi:PTS glucitol/sorbitol transporter subunit IIA [Pediococcus claussenii]|uniref:PTS system glucitol/sorbitol-specific IIA component family protein n=1 Tax=Pediococcus claussenii (strain ATCC BAA-344 / DSM 14800 / JCM 18046 / KCTC 3811 / LMG 21948 / P06) TaxID=701521 RepID=G8PCT4_PEDCP|nr:PTS glucitol/sorbitol transporter subunit IIA [Pediococcus claussenii]AEV95069.1 PTS system glucitol/sorbitol-specific IIA component family protein [Pediococcus claussenii ATCC BAA-344]ANZ70257.1 glucitol/sorbitol PTS, EIIA [Pediococcus claussenii]ANZ72073.1 glucitol/sorbitol PTS, EIIA [Pediococcus claussenii]KRN18930.1 hypothetical protein IV79_GL001773 [Pediococcus claussenii]